MNTTAPFLPPCHSRLPAPELERALAKALETSPLIIAIFDPPDLRLVYLNGMGRRLLDPGRKVEWDQTDHGLPSLVGPSSLDLYTSQIGAHLDVLGRWQGALHLLDADGSEVAVLATLSRITPSPGIVRVCLQAIRPDALRETDDGRPSDQDYLNALLNHLPDWVYFKDRNGRYLRASRSLGAHVGLDDPRGLIGRTDFDVFSVEHAAAVRSAEQTILETGQPLLDHEEKETLPDGRDIWVSTTKLPLRDTAGGLLGTFGVSRNITARKHTENERRELELKLQLAHKLESIGMLAAGVAHEINTPTQFIADNTRFLQTAFAQLAEAVTRIGELLPRDAAATAAFAKIAGDTDLTYNLSEIPRTLEQTLDGLGRVTRIVASLKEFSHPHALERAPADLNRAVETTLAVARHEWKYVADAVTELDPDLPPVPCVIDQFNQVVLNLVINAAHAIAEVQPAAGAAKGVITVRTRREAADAVLEVSDTGAGIPPAIRDRIFELFFTTKRADKGTGQGLALVRSIIQRHGGRIDFDSEVGRGTTFRVRLPLQAPDAPPAA